MSENTVKHEHKQCGGKNIEKMEEIGKTMPVEEEIYDVAELFKVLGDQCACAISQSCWKCHSQLSRISSECLSRPDL